MYGGAVNLAVSRIAGYRRRPLVAPAARVVEPTPAPRATGDATSAPIDVELLWEEPAYEEQWGAPGDVPARPLALTPAAVASAYAASRPRFVRAPLVDVLVV